MQIQKISNQQVYNQKNNKQNTSFGMYFGIKPEVVASFSKSVQEIEKLDLAQQKLSVIQLKKHANNFLTKLLRDMVEHNETAENHKIYDSINEIKSIKIAHRGNNVNPTYQLTTNYGDEFRFSDHSLYEIDDEMPNIIDKFQKKLILSKTTTEEARQVDNNYLLSKLSYVQKKKK